MPTRRSISSCGVFARKSADSLAQGDDRAVAAGQREGDAPALYCDLAVRPEIRRALELRVSGADRYGDRRFTSRGIRDP